MAEQLERGKCRGCPAPIVWIKTTAGKAVPCDEEAFSGYVIRKGAKPLPKGWRQGYTVAGRVVRILPDAAPRPLEPLIPGLEPGPLLEERATVRETHFATCPARQRFRQIQDERKRKAEERAEHRRKRPRG